MPFEKKKTNSRVGNIQRETRYVIVGANISPKKKNLF